MPGDGGTISEEPETIVRPNNFVAEDDEKWNLEGIVAAEKVVISYLRRKARARQEKCRTEEGRTPVDILPVDAPAEQSLK